MSLHGFASELSHSLFLGVSVCACLYSLAFAILYGIFRRTSVCVCLVGFASLQSSWAYTHKASLPLYERSVGFASVQSLWAFISGILALLAPPVAPNLSARTTLPKLHYPSPCTITLGSLAKGSWIAARLFSYCISLYSAISATLISA